VELLMPGTKSLPPEERGSAHPLADPDLRVEGINFTAPILTGRLKNFHIFNLSQFYTV